MANRANERCHKNEIRVVIAPKLEEQHGKRRDADCAHESGGNQDVAFTARTERKRRDRQPAEARKQSVLF